MAETGMERVARALWNAESVRATDRPRRVQWSEESEKTRESWRHMARVAIEAMREPTEAMTMAGFWARDYEGQETDEVYRRMIDTLLKEEGQ